MTTVVIDDLKLLYLHIPKTAGTSISKWIRNKSLNACIYHSHPLLCNVPNLNPDINYFKFTCVRNPWARALSGYQNMVRHYRESRTDLMYNLINEVIKLNGSFPEFNRWVELLPNCNSMVGVDWNMKTTQTEWISPGVDLIIRVENLNEEFKPINQLFNDNNPLMHLNKSELNIDYRTVYNDNSKKIISRCFESDIDLFKYSY